MERRKPKGEEADAADSQDQEAVARDIVLVGRVRRGDMEAYGQLVQRHMRRAFSIAYSILQHREDAEDVVQEAFMRTLQNIHRIEKDRPFHPWFNRIVVNSAISHRRARSVRKTAPLPEEVSSGAPGPDRIAERAELGERLVQAVDALPEQQRTIVLLSDVEEFNSSEIANILDMPAGTVRYHLHLGRRALRDMLSKGN